MEAAGAAPTADLEYSAIDESTAAQIMGGSTDRDPRSQSCCNYREITKQMFAQVKGDLGLMAAAVRSTRLLQF